MLRVDRISARYGRVPVLDNVTFEVRTGEMVALIGANGAGKSTVLKTIIGAIAPFSGTVSFQRNDITRMETPDIVKLGIAYVPEGKLVFSPLSIEENLRLGAYLVACKEEVEARLDYVYRLFPRLAERRRQRAGTLSGGEQTMVALGRGLMAKPRLLMLDEPSLGLMPKLVEDVFETIERLKGEGLTVLLVEQRAREALELADRGYVLQTGKIVAASSRDELLGTEKLRRAFLGR